MFVLSKTKQMLHTVMNGQNKRFKKQFVSTDLKLSNFPPNCSSTSQTEQTVSHSLTLLKMLCMPEGVYQVKACYTVLSTAFLTVLFGHFDQYIAERDKLYEIHFTSSNITSSPGHIKVSNVHRIRNQSTNSWLGNRATGAADTHVF